jgi:hypothetical protein
MDRLGKNVHVFDLDAEPEPVHDHAAMQDTSNDGGDVIDDGFGPIDDPDDDEGNWIVLQNNFQ